MKSESNELFSKIADRYAAEGSPERSGWCFDAGTVTDAHRELEIAGLIQRFFGAPGGFGWRLTDAGLQQIKASA